MARDVSKAVACDWRPEGRDALIANPAQHSPIRIVVNRPEVAGDTVTFRWSQDAPNPFQRGNAFYLRYQDLDLTQFTSAVFYEIFLGLQLKVFAAYRAPVEVVFPDPIPHATVAFWSAFHGAEHVTISPMSDESTYEPWAAAHHAPPDHDRHAVFFGGGKDSTFTTCLLAELFGGPQVLLIQFVVPLRPSTELEQRLDERQERQMLRPARENLGVGTRRVWTDYQANFRQDADRARPHIEIYTLGALPLLLAHGVSLATFSYAWTEYALIPLDAGQRQFRFANSRPEVLAHQSRHYQRVLGTDLTITNLALLFSSITTFKILAERYPAALKQIVPCTAGNVDERWCYNCKKCGLHAMLSLAEGWIDPDFDYDRLFSSRFAADTAAYAETGVECSVLDNAPWHRTRSGAIGLAYWHALAKIAIETVADRLGIESYTNLVIMRTLFGNRTFPALEVLPIKAIELLDIPVARDIARIAAEYVPPADVLEGPLLMGNQIVDYDFGIVMPTRLSGLPHLQ
jgi:hypothetical protein